MYRSDQFDLINKIQYQYLIKEIDSDINKIRIINLQRVVFVVNFAIVDKINLAA